MNRELIGKIDITKNSPGWQLLSISAHQPGCWGRGMEVESVDGIAGGDMLEYGERLVQGNLQLRDPSLGS